MKLLIKHYLDIKVWDILSSQLIPSGMEGINFYTITDRRLVLQKMKESG